MGVWSYAASGRRRWPEAAAWPLGGLGAALAVAGIVHAAVAGPGGGAVEDARHMGVFVLGAALVLLRATTVRAGRDVWLALGIGATLDALAQGLWTFAYGGSLRASPADAVFGVAYLVGCVGLSLYLRRRVGHALRTFSFDAIGITVYVGAVGAAFLLRPIMETLHVSQLSAAVCVFYPAADAALFSIIFAVSSFTGRRMGAQDQLLGGAFVALFTGDVLLVLGQGGILGAGAHPWAQLVWELASLGIAPAAWAPPSPAGTLRVGGWWESGPTLSWIAAGGGVLVAARIWHLPTMVVVLGGLTLALAALRGVRVVGEVRNLVVVRAESLVDELTGVGNQRALFDELALLMREDGRDGQRLALLIGHLEGFDELTDTLGHEASGELLRHVARRLGAVAPGTLARLHGDEFATLVEDGDPERLAGAFAAALAAPIAMDGIAVSVRPVFGYARFPEDAATPAGLASRADVARRDARARGLDVAAYDPARDGHSRDRLALTADLRAALGAHPASPDGLWLAFQPQVMGDTGVVYGLEALIRWCHPTRGEVSPAELLPVAQRGGLMSALTDWVLDRAIAEAARLRDEGHPLRVSVNVSAVTLVDVGLPDRIADALRRHDVPAERLTVEVTEDAVMRDHRRCREVLAAIAALGVEIAIDDFGTGQSSLGQLRTLPADELKIDRRFVSGMAADPLDAEIVRMVIGLGRRMGLRVVAEGIESDAERDLLRELGCDGLQGFGIGRPMAAGALRDWLAAVGTTVTS